MILLKRASPMRRLSGLKNSTQRFSSLSHFPERGVFVPEAKKFPGQLFFGSKTDTYGIIYSVDKRNRVVRILHIRHGARAALYDE